MDRIKTKNIVIITLLLVNLTLLALVASDRIRTANGERSMRAELSSILAENGITLGEDADLTPGELPYLRAERDLSSELSSAEKLLGDVTVTDRGGNILLYSGTLGQGEFRGTGSFSVLINLSEAFASDDMNASAEDFCKKLGVKFAADGAEDASVTGCCVVNGARVINCRINFTFSGGGINLVTGTKPPDKLYEDESTPTLDISTVLMRFLATVRSEGYVCSRLEEIELCYFMTATTAGEANLTPLWRLGTDAGDIYINGVTGRNETF